MKVISFDQSTRVTGFAIFVDGKYFRSGIIDLSKIKNTEERTREMGIAICKEISLNAPDVIIIEEVAMQSNADTLKKLARIQGVAIGFAAAHNIPLHILEPSRWRSVLRFKQGSKVKREELKKQSADYVKDKYGLQLREDETEAICIGEAAQKIYGFESDEEI